MENKITRYDALAGKAGKLGRYALEAAELTVGAVCGLLPAEVQGVIARIPCGDDEKAMSYAAGMSRMSSTAEIVVGGLVMAAIAIGIGASGPAAAYGMSLLGDGVIRKYVRAENEPLGSLPLEIPYDLVRVTIDGIANDIKKSKKIMRGTYVEEDIPPNGGSGGGSYGGG